jgi:Domain of unknown function (DUF4190)
MADETPPPLPAQSAPIATAPRTEPLAIWSLILSILSFFGCLFFTVIPAIICGHVARSKIRKSNGARVGMGIVLVALILSYVQIPLGVLGGIMLVDMIRSERVRLHELEAEKKEIASDDGKLKFTTSGFWVQRTDLNKRAALQASRKDKELYVMVITDPKSTVADLTLEQHHQTTRDHMLKQMSNSSATTTLPVTIDGHSALQDELTGTQQGSNVVFLHTTVDDGDSFQQILAWTLKSRWAANKSELADITNSFHSQD